MIPLPSSRPVPVYHSGRVPCHGPQPNQQVQPRRGWVVQGQSERHGSSPFLSLPLLLLVSGSRLAGPTDCTKEDQVQLGLEVGPDDEGVSVCGLPDLDHLRLVGTGAWGTGRVEELLVTHVGPCLFLGPILVEDEVDTCLRLNKFGPVVHVPFQC